MAYVTIWACRRRARKNNAQARSSLLQGSTHRGGSRLVELSGSTSHTTHLLLPELELTSLLASEITPLLENALEHKETKPKTNTTVVDERSKLLEVISLLNNHKETPENSQKIFDCLQGLIENLQDQQAVSQVPYDVDFALFHCNELAKISKRIHQKRPGAPTVAHFYKGQVLFTQARLQELRRLTQATSSTAETLFEKAFQEFAAAKQVSDRLQKPLDVETQKYRSRSLYACAFILAKFPKFARMETKLVKDQEYLAAGAEMLETARHQGDLVEVMIKLDEELIRRLAA
jgi:hypothetical protein